MTPHRSGPELPSLDVRDATRADAAVVADIYMRSWFSSYDDLVPVERLEPVAAERARHDWEAAIVGEGSRLGIGHVGRLPAGIVQVGDDPDEDVGGAWLVLLYVVPELWGSGISTMLLRWATDEAREAGEPLLRLRVLEPQHRARRFYEREGWSYDDGVPPIHNEFFPQLCMRIDLR